MSRFPHLSDLTVILKDPTGQTKTVATHKVILAMKSEFFLAMLTGPFRESGESRITVEVSDLDAATKLIEWFYHPRRSLMPLEAFELAEQWLVPTIVPVNQLQYPGPPGIFVRGRGDWPEGLSSQVFSKRWEFTSTTPESIIQCLDIMRTLYQRWALP
jgi:hypothetical protein